MTRSSTNSCSTRRSPGTPLYEKHKSQGSLLPEEESPIADAHGQYRFNYRHAHIPAGLEEGYLVEAFRRDFAVNGPSLLRLIRVLLNGWLKYRDDPRPRVRGRVAWEAFPLRSVYAGAVWAMRRWYRNDPRLLAKADRLLEDLYAAFGLFTRLAAPVLGRYVWLKLKKRRGAPGRGVELRAPDDPRDERSGPDAPEKASRERRRTRHGARGGRADHDFRQVREGRRLAKKKSPGASPGGIDPSKPFSSCAGITLSYLWPSTGDRHQWALECVVCWIPLSRTITCISDRLTITLSASGRENFRQGVIQRPVNPQRMRANRPAGRLFH